LPSNIELKIRWKSPESAIHKAESFGASYSKTMEQVDTYFSIKDGKLKLREILGERAELIYYNRQGDRKWRSDYVIAGTMDPENLKIILGSILRVLVVVKKRRLLYLVDNARIHIDEVEGLGSFIEFEVIIREGEDQAAELLKRLRDHFMVSEENVLKVSYSDLLMKV